MQGYVRFVERNRRVLLAVFVVISLVAVAGVVQLKINADLDIFRVADSKYQRVLERMDALFGTSDQIIVLIESDAEGLSTDVVRELRRAQAFMEGLPGVEMVQGPAPQTISMGMWEVDLTGSLTTQDLERLREHYEGMGKLSTLVEHDGRLNGVFTIYPTEDFDHAALGELERFLDAEGYAYSVTGDLFMQQKIVDYIQRILYFLPPTALLLVLLVFRSQMRSMKATIFSILPAGVAAVWTLGIVGWLGDPVSIITVLAPIFTIVIGSADGLHFVSHVQDSQSEGKATQESLAVTLRMVGVPMIITTVTSMAGFLALLVMNTAAIRDLALFASLGIFLAGVASWYVLPVILVGGLRLGGAADRKAMAGDAAAAAGNGRARGPLRLLPRLWGWWSVGAAVLLVAFGILGLQLLSTQFSQLSIFRDRTDVHRSFERITEVNGGSIPVYLLIEAEEDLLAPDRGRRVLELEEELAALPEVGKVVSAYDALALINAGMFGRPSPTYPERAEGVDLIWNVISGQGNPVGHLINREAGAARMIVFPTDLQNETLDAIADRAREFDRANEDLRIEVTGSQYLMRELNRSMLGNQGRTILLAFGIILILLLISLRAFRPALISLLPIGVTTLVIFGFMGVAGISLSLFTATMFSITIGIGIDYAVHFTSVWKRFTEDGSDAATAAERAFAYTGRPIVANAFGLAIGLSALMLSPLRIHLYMSALMWVAMVAAVFLSLSFLPTILRKVGTGSGGNR